MKTKILVFFILITFFNCKEPTENKIPATKLETSNSNYINLDSIDLINEKKIEYAQGVVNKLFVSKKDSSVEITPSKFRDYRIFGYQKPDIKSKKLILISCFTGDVENNPFEFPLGAYYQLDETHTAKFLRTVNNFVEVKFTLHRKIVQNIYIEKKWIVFDDY